MKKLYKFEENDVIYIYENNKEIKALVIDAEHLSQTDESRHKPKAIVDDLIILNNAIVEEDDEFHQLILYRKVSEIDHKKEIANVFVDAESLRVYVSKLAIDELVEKIESIAVEDDEPRDLHSYEEIYMQTYHSYMHPEMHKAEFKMKDGTTLTSNEISDILYDRFEEIEQSVEMIKDNVVFYYSK